MVKLFVHESFALKIDRNFSLMNINIESLNLIKITIYHLNKMYLPSEMLKI